jgi:hypothetical protein
MGGADHGGLARQDHVVPHTAAERGALSTAAASARPLAWEWGKRQASLSTLSSSLNDRHRPVTSDGVGGMESAPRFGVIVSPIDAHEPSLSTSFAKTLTHTAEGCNA